MSDITRPMLRYHGGKWKLAPWRRLVDTLIVCNLLYEEYLGDWRRIERPALADGARPRTEVLWLSPNIHSGQRSFDMEDV